MPFFEGSGAFKGAAQVRGALVVALAFGWLILRPENSLDSSLKWNFTEEYETKKSMKKRAFQSENVVENGSGQEILLASGESA